MTASCFHIHILSALDKEYGTDFICYLNYETPWQLLIAVILSAQCTDARVNIVTADLFKKYPTIKDFAAADLKELEQDIRSIGFYHMKAKNIIQCAKRLVEEYGGIVPEKMEDLLTLGGHQRSHLPGGGGAQDGQRDPGKYLPCAKYCGGYPCKAHFQEAGAYKRDRAGKDRVGSDEDTPGRSLDSLEYPYHYFRADHLYCQKAGLRKLLFKTMVSCL